MQRQVWVFLTEADEEALWSRIAAAYPVRRLRGRFFRGSLEKLRSAPETLETRELRSTESWTHLLHDTASRELVTHAVDDGPMKGFSRLDEVRSEVISIVRPTVTSQGLGPARIQAATHAWFGGKRLRKGPEFSRWTNEVLAMAESFPTTAFDWIHVAPQARSFATGGGRLHYLYRSVPLEAQASTHVTRPHKGR